MTKKTKVTKKNEASRSELLRKPYARILTPDESGQTYVAQVLEFPGCVAEGDTPAKAYANLERAANAWIEAAHANGQGIPEPTFDKIRDYGGKVALRLPRSVHREAVRFAEMERMSLNTFLVSSVSAAVGAMNLYEHIARRFEIRAVRALTRAIVAVTAGQPEQSTSLYEVTAATTTPPLLIGDAITHGRS